MPARSGRPGVRPVVQGVGVLSVPGGLVLSGHPVAGIVFFSMAAACYGLVLLSALFGSPEISRRGFRLLGMAEGPTGNGRGQISPLRGHGRVARVCNPPVVIAGDGFKRGREQ